MTAHRINPSCAHEEPWRFSALCAHGEPWSAFCFIRLRGTKGFFFEIVRSWEPRSLNFNTFVNIFNIFRIFEGATFKNEDRAVGGLATLKQAKINIFFVLPTDTEGFGSARAGKIALSVKSFVQKCDFPGYLV